MTTTSFLLHVQLDLPSTAQLLFLFSLWLCNNHQFPFMELHFQNIMLFSVLMQYSNISTIAGNRNTKLFQHHKALPVSLFAILRDSHFNTLFSIIFPTIDFSSVLVSASPPTCFDLTPMCIRLVCVLSLKQWFLGKRYVPSYSYSKLTRLDVPQGLDNLLRLLSALFCLW